MPIIRIPIKGGMTIPNTTSLDHGTYMEIKYNKGISKDPVINFHQYYGMSEKGFFKHCSILQPTLVVLLMAEILNNHLGWC